MTKRILGQTADAKILLLDIETAPSLGWVWGKWEQNVIEFKADWYMLSFSVKWLGKKKKYTRGLIDYASFKKDKENDGGLVKDLWKFLDQADIVIGHNLDKFDIKKSNARFISHGLPPPSPYKTVDTLKIAKRAFKFDSNKLDELGRYFGIGRKIPHTGFKLWLDCMQGNTSAWKLMKQYNGHDVDLLEKVYYKVRAWSPTHPNVNQNSRSACPKCGSKHIHARGFSYTMLSKKPRYQCQNCTGWFAGSAQKIN